MAGWGIAEWYGKDVATMSGPERHEAASRAIAAKDAGVTNSPQPECPFLSSIRPGSSCNKVGGVCSVRQYSAGSPATALEAQPTTVCPNRFLEFRNKESLFGTLAHEIFGSTDGARVIKEIPFLEKETMDGEQRGAKAGRIDWILVPKPSSNGDQSDLPWLAIETQAVYFSGDSMWPDIEEYLVDPDQVHFPKGRRRPDYRSSGAKRLAPQLSAKAPVMNRWGRKVAVVVDEAFFAEMGALAETTDFDNAEVVWVLVKYDSAMKLTVSNLLHTELSASIAALQAAKPVNKREFESQLRDALSNAKIGKVFDA